jgi:hypothetical protein
MDLRHVRAFIEGTVDLSTGKFSSITRAQGFYVQTGYGIAVIDGDPETEGFKTFGSSFNGTGNSFTVGTATVECSKGESSCTKATQTAFSDSDSDFWNNASEESEEYQTAIEESGPLEFSGDLKRTWLPAE